MELATKNTCYTYFKITGDFDPDTVTDILGLTPDKQHKKGEYRKDGSPYDFSAWEFGRCSTYDVYTENQMRQTIAPLLGKVALLQKIREGNDVVFTLEVVPSLYVDDINPCLAPPMDVIDFCHATRTQIDVDLYLYGNDGDQ